MGSIPDSCHVGLPLPQCPSDVAYSSGPSSVVSTRETSPASSTHRFVTAPSPSLFRPNETNPSMDPYNNLFHALDDQTVKVLSSGLQHNGGPLSSNHLCANDKTMKNPSPLPFMGERTAQLSPSYFCPSAADSLSGMGSIASLTADEARANVSASPISSYHTPKVSSTNFRHKATQKPSGTPYNRQTTSLAANKATTNVLSPSTVNQQRVLVTPDSSRKPSHIALGVSHQHSTSLAASLAVNKAMAIDASPSTPVKHQAEDLPSRFRSMNHSPSGMSYPQPARLVSNETPTSNTLSIVDDRTAKASSGSFRGVNHSPTGITGATGISSLAGTGPPETIKSGHPPVPPSQPHSSTPVPHGPTTNSWQSSTASLSSLAFPSTAAHSSTNGPSSSPPHNNPHTHFTTTTTATTATKTTDQTIDNSDINNTLSSPVSSVQFGPSNAFPRHYISIANPTRVQTTATSSFRNDADRTSQATSTFPHDGDHPIQSNSLLRHDVNRTIQPTSASRHDVYRPIQPTSAFRREFEQSSHIPSASTSQANIASMHPTKGLVIAKGDMDKAMAYCYDRGDGTFTRLVPVDLLPVELEDIPARVMSHEGMIVLPIPRKAGPNGQPANSQLAPQTMTTPPSTPSRTTGTSTDLIQSRIDRIINSTPATSGAVVLARGAGSGPIASKREKIYCDKWIHDGTCAFTQQGCKFKHEMPTDKETQMSLGLFHGFPPWWRRYCAERSMPLDDSPVHVPGTITGTGTGNNSVSGHGHFSGVSRHGSGGVFGPSSGGGALNAVSWRRRIEAPPAEGGPSSSFGAGGGSGGRFGRGRGGQGRTVARYSQQPANFGPICPPSKSDAGSDTKRKAVAASTAASAASSPEHTYLRGRFAPRRGGGAPLNLNQCDALEDLGEADEKADKAGKADKADKAGKADKADKADDAGDAGDASEELD